MLKQDACDQGLLAAEARPRASLEHLLRAFDDRAPNGPSHVMVRGDGVHLWDQADRRYIDGMSGIWCVQVGYGQRALIDAGAAQLARLPFCSAFGDTASAPAMELAERLAALAPAAQQHVFFCSSGSEATETAIRMVHHYWAVQKQPKRQVVIGRWGAYHGSTAMAASLAGNPSMPGLAGLSMPGIDQIAAPHWAEWRRRHGGRDGGVSADEFGLRAARCLEQKILALGPDRVAAFIGEPVMGACGVVVPPDSYWPEIQRICRRHGVLLVSDEVSCGFGRLGHWFGCQRFGFEPDLLTFAKGVTSGYQPLAGVMIGAPLSEALRAAEPPWRHGFTHSGHPVACAVALANLRLLHEQSLVERVRLQVGPALGQGLASLYGHPLVGEVEACGLMAAVQIVRDPTTLERFPADWRIGHACHAHCRRLGLIVRTVQDRVIVAPPLVVSRDEIGDILSRLRQALDLTLAACARR